MDPVRAAAGPRGRAGGGPAPVESPSALATELRARIEALPGAERLLSALEGLPSAFLVGGAVRDLLLGWEVVDLDVAVESNATGVARELARRLGGEAVAHDRFGTASVRASPLDIDLATTRRERYSRPGVLPEVEPAPLAEDLGRRDFTINAMAAGLTGPDLGRLHDPYGGRDDLVAGVVRVLHEASFVDDPTRLLRALRYEARLGLGMDPATERLARAAAEGGAFGTVSGARVRDELLDLLAEPAALPRGLERLRALGLDRALHPALLADPALATAAAGHAGEVGADRALTALAALVLPAEGDLAAWLDELHLGADRRGRLAAAARGGRRLAEMLREGPRPSELRWLLDREPPEALALALALGAPSEPVSLYLHTLRQVHLEVTGDELRAAGVAESPALGRALRETLRRKLNGEVSGHQSELQMALRLAREGP